MSEYQIRTHGGSLDQDAWRKQLGLEVQRELMQRRAGAHEVATPAGNNALEQQLLQQLLLGAGGPPAQTGSLQDMGQQLEGRVQELQG